MSNTRVEICIHIVRECFGDVVEKVLSFLLKNGPSPFRYLCSKTELKNEQVKKSLQTLLQHNLLTFEESKKGLVEYKADTDHILTRLHYPQYIYTAKTLYGDTAELLIEELLESGQLQMSNLLQRVTVRLDNDNSAEKVTVYTLKEKFVCLAQTRFIQRCPVVDPTVDTADHCGIPQFCTGDIDVYQVPNVNCEGQNLKDGNPQSIAVLGDFPQRGLRSDQDQAQIPNPCLEKRKRKLSEDEGSSQPSKRRKVETEDKQVDEDIYWKVNMHRFNQHIRDQHLVNAVSSKFDKKAAEVLRTILRSSEVKSNEAAKATTPISYNEIWQALPKELGCSRTALEQYLKLLSDDSMDFVQKTGDSGGGMYSIHFVKAFDTLTKAHVESMIQERFGSKCLRIFRLLLLKKRLEQKQIEEAAMIPAKEAKEMLYTMFGENLVHINEVPRTPDFAPSRTFYLFSVDLNQVVRNMLERCYKTLYNLMLRRQCETKEHRRVLEKQQRVEAITASLEQQGADAQQKEEIEEMITPAERTQLTKIKHITDKLDLSEIQVDSTIFVLKTFLDYQNKT